LLHPEISAGCGPAIELSGATHLPIQAQEEFAKLSIDKSLGESKRLQFFKTERM